MEHRLKQPFMNFEVEKLLAVIVSLFALFFTVFTFWFNHKKAKLQKTLDEAIELEKAHLTDAKDFRLELREEIKNLKSEVKDLKTELRKTENELEITKQDLTDLQKDFLDISATKKQLEQEKESLLNRVRELEKQVKTINKKQVD